MVLTKSLYRYDEVVSAFLYSLKRRRVTESHFWLQELIKSDYENDVRGLLLVGWIMRVGLLRVSWLYDWVYCTSVETNAILCNNLNTIQDRDSSLWWLIWYAVTKEEQPSISSETAFKEKNLAASWWYFSRFPEEEFWKYIDEYTNTNKMNVEVLSVIMSGLKKVEGFYGIFARCAALATVLTHVELPPSTWKRCTTVVSPDTEALYEKMLSVETSVIRKQRLYSVPWDCLFGMTTRGCGHSTEDELLSKLEKGMRKSKVWQSRILPFQTSRGEWMNELIQERFYDTYFCYIEGDIPDEWSKEDRAKSHGPHITNCQGGMFGRWWRNWSFQEHQFIKVGDAQTVQTWMNEYLINLDETIFETLEGLYTQLIT